METVVDTNLILDNPNILLERENIIVPLSVVEELDNFKNDKRLGFFAREATRIMIDNDIKVKGFNVHSTDNLLVYLSNNGYKVLTRDYNVYLKCNKDNRGLYQQDDDLYEGLTELPLDPELVDELYDKDKVRCDDGWYYENQFIDAGNVIARYSNGYLYRVDWDKKLEGIEKLNRQQIMAYDLLFDPKIKIVLLWGSAGTGKTSLAIKSAFSMVKSEMYNEILLSRPKIETGNKEERLGILPGDKFDKLSEHIMPFKDNMNSFQYEIIPDVQPLTTIKGRDIKNTFYIIDEAQDIRPRDIIPIIERIGSGSKVVFTGDPNQIDVSSLNLNHNGVTFLSNALKGDDLFGCVRLIKNERSEVAQKGDLLRKKLYNRR